MKIVNLIDVSGFVYRAFYALPSMNSNGKNYGAVYGFCSAMLKLLSQFPNSMSIATLDSSKKTFRNEIYSDYKSNRKETPEELITQIPIIKRACQEFGFFISEQIGFEADDIIASYAELLKNEDIQVNIISSDKDLMQLLAISNVRIFDPLKQKYITEEDVFKKFGVHSKNVLDVLSLMGDSSDNIPGVPGIGPKTAALLINEYKSLDNLIANIDNLPENKRNNTLRSEIDKALLSRKLASLRFDVPLTFEYKETEHNSLNEFFEELGFKSLIRRIINNCKQIPTSQYESITSESIFMIEDDCDLGKNKTILENETIPKICQDSKTIIKKCWDLKIDIKNTIDTSIMSYCIYGPQKETAPYEELVTHLDNKELFELENKIALILAKMEYKGILIDVSYLHELDNYFQDKINCLTMQIYAIAGVSFNIASPKQVAFILFEKLGLQSVTKKQSTDSDSLANLSGLMDGITDKILLWREYSKLQNTYVKSLIKSVDLTNRVHTTYLQTVVNTGRLSSSNPNLQNIPNRSDEGKKIRKAFIAPKGKKLISFDYSQIELRLLAHLSSCSKLINSFKNKIDIHIATAGNIFKVDPSDVTKEQRRMAKEINFSILYGMSIHHLSGKLGIPRKEAEIIYNGFFDLYPEVLDYIKSTEEFAAKHGYVTTILGRKCFVPLINNKNKNLANFAKRQAVNAPIQGSNADIIKLSMIEIDKHDFCYSMLLQIHDELVFEVPDEKVDECIELVKNIMENIINIDIPLDVNVKTGANLW